MERKEIKTEFVIVTILFVIYLTVNAILLVGHELWRDEANVWLLARDTTVGQLITEMKYQGHPCLWYLLVMPFAKFGLPFKTISVLSFCVMAVAAGLFVYRAPFSRLTKMICLLSPIFSYYYPVVARNYCLIALLLVLLACLYEKRNENSIWYGLLLGFLVQADTIAIVPAGIISFMWLCECIGKSVKEKSKQPLLVGIKGLWIPLVSLFFWIVQFYQVSDSPEYGMRRLQLNEFLKEIRNVSYSILSRMTGQDEKFGLVLIILFLLAGVILSITIKNGWNMIVVIGMFLFEVVFSIMIYQLHIWHYIVICFVLIWCFWLGLSEAKKKENTNRWVVVLVRGLAEGCLILLGITMFMRWNAPEENSSLRNALSGVYSDGVNVASYIEENVDTTDLIITTDVAEASTVQAYLGEGYNFYYATTGQRNTYARYTSEERTEITYSKLLDWIKTNYPDKKYFYLLMSPTNYVTDIPDSEKEKWKICYETKERTARNENYCLYYVMIEDGR